MIVWEIKGYVLAILVYEIHLRKHTHRHTQEKKKKVNLPFWKITPFLIMVVGHDFNFK